MSELGGSGDRAMARVRLPGVLRQPIRWLLSSAPGGAKMLHETLCVAQSDVGNSRFNEGRKRSHVWRLQWLINLVEWSGAYRPSR